MVSALTLSRRWKAVPVCFTVSVAEEMKFAAVPRTAPKLGIEEIVNKIKENRMER